MLERQIMFKQLQELQRQKKLEELNDGSRQQNVMDQKLSFMHYKQSSGTQYPLLNNGIPVRDASQMFKFGSTNLLHGLSNKLAQNQTVSNESASLLTKHNSQVNNHDRYASSRFSEKMEKVGNNQDLASLDPLEQKILFNMEDNSWGTSFGKSFENTDHTKDAPSLQSGSWSALMQSAVAEACSSDTGIQEEWGGSSYQNPELSNENQSSNIVESGKRPTPWLYNKLPKTELISSIQHVPATHVQNPKIMHSDAKHQSPKEAGQGFRPLFPKKVAPPSQRQVVNYFNPSRTSLQAGHSSKPFQDPQFNNNQLRNQNYMTSRETTHLVSVKNEDGQQLSNLEAKQRPLTAGIGQQTIWVDVPVQQNLFGIGSCKPPSSTTNSRMETVSEVSKRLGYWKYVKSENNFSETDAHMNNSQGLDDGRGFASKTHIRKETLSGNLETHSRSFYSQHLNVANQNMVVLKSKKRKWPTFECLPWHKEVTEGCLGIHDMSAAEMEWAQSANRLPEKIEIIQQFKKEARKGAPSLLVVQPKRRLVLTTQLMQLLFRPPAVAPSEDATAHCDTVTYYAAKLALGDACSLAGHSHTPHDISGSPSRTSVIPKHFNHLNLSKTVEGLIDRSKRLEDELLRLEKGESSILDLRVEFQDLDKISVINRFAKFHGRGPLVTADTASSEGASTAPKLYPLRYVTTRPMPKMVPEGQRCLSL